MSNLLPKYNFIQETRPLYKMGPRKEGNIMASLCSFSEEQELAMGRVEQQVGMDVQRWVSMGSDDLLLIAWLL